MGNKTRYSSQFALGSKQLLDFAPTLLIGAMLQQMIVHGIVEPLDLSVTVRLEVSSRAQTVKPKNGKSLSGNFEKRHMPGHLHRPSESQPPQQHAQESSAALRRAQGTQQGSGALRRTQESSGALRTLSNYHLIVCSTSSGMENYAL
jgi:hypothetical protein